MRPKGSRAPGTEKSAIDQPLRSVAVRHQHTLLVIQDDPCGIVHDVTSPDQVNLRRQQGFKRGKSALTVVVTEAAPPHLSKTLR